jgi:HK97 gp10 family phage protein
MANDVKVTVKDDKQGFVYAIIRGGKYTGYKWHMVENGTSHSRAMHFIEKALNNAEDEIENIVDEAIRKAVQGGN